MKQTLNYNIHNILKFQILLDKKFNLFNYFNIEHRFFQVDHIDKPDIILNIGKFKPSNEESYIVDGKYYIKNNYFYCKDSEGTTKWEVEISGFESGDTIINFDIKVPGVRGFLPILSAHNLFLSSVIDYKLSNKGYFLIHSAGLGKDNKAFLLAGMGGAFKTTLAMDFIRKAGFDFFGDERVIFNDGRIWSYPVGLVSFDYRCSYLPTENKRNFLDKIGLIKHNINNYDNLRRLKVNVPEMSELKALFFIVKKSARKSMTINEYDLKKAVDKLITNNMMEMNHAYMPNLMGISSNPFFEYMLAYSFIFPESQIAAHWINMKNRLVGFLKGIPIYEMEIPGEYNDVVFKEVSSNINLILKE
ncbi:MAG: hypothetical protein MPEBLZ_00357 [Candidatus Methanoperedens nitroreducens]|uniref:HPr kinase n=1 Tax=Candidatus Methanoperedens nitratireducens TaxID=1392998 RepID=A0A0P8CDE9_9EURY|nr:MAG: hypothetical protein MPEBLZ_00357 [Candidatus Methanoperedens sp. BLZ1]MCX9088457.1 hypothetical protein [Candidatus Methanoperedens sp.]